MARIESEDDGQLINGRYRLVEVIGRGGMGTVWHGHDEMLDREVAIKEIRLPPDLSDEERSLLSERAKREARATAGLSHPGVITVHDVIEHDGAPMIVMEYIDGHSLADAIKEEVKLPWRRVAEIGADMLDALRAAHMAGIVHRDLKPANVLLSGDRVIITDFGIAHRSGETTLSEPGELVGTPAFMAPEQAEHATTTPASDLWSLGATLFAAVEGRPPYTGPDFVTTLLSLLTQEPPEPRNAGPLGPVIDSLLRKDPDRRATAESTAAALDTILHDDAPPPAPPPPSTAPQAPAPSAAPAPPTPSHALPPLQLPPPSTWQPVHVHPAPVFQPHGISRPRRGGAGQRRGAAGQQGGGAKGIVLLAFFVFVIGALWLGHHSNSGDVSADPIPSFSFNPSDLPFPDISASASPSPTPSTTADPLHAKAVAMSADGKTVAVARTNGNDGTVRLWHTADQKPFATLPIDATALAFSPDGKTLAVYDGSRIDLLSLASHREERSVATSGTLSDNGVTALAFSPDGTTIDYAADAPDSANFGTWRTDTDTLTVASTDGPCDLDALSSDGRTLACTSGSGSDLALWDVTSRSKTTIIMGPTDSATEAFALKGDSLANANSQSITLSALRGEQADSTLPSGTLMAHLAFAAHGGLVGVDQDGDIHLWNVITHQQVAQWSAIES